MNTFTKISLLCLIALSVGCAQVVGTVSGPIDHDPGKRSFGTRIDDEVIETSALVNIRKAAPELSNSHINAISYNHIVLLVGQVPSAEMRDLAARTAAKVGKVRKVHNHLTVSGKTTMLIRSNDGWLTTKIKAALVNTDGVRANKVKVVTENGEVFLMGIVSAAEGELATQVASRTNGVRKVTKLFEYLP